MLLLFTMSLMGSISIFLFLLTEHISSDLLSIHAKRLYLIITASMFIIPYPEFMIMYKHFLITCLMKCCVNFKSFSNPQIITEQIIQVTPHGMYNQDFFICIYLLLGSTIILSFFIHNILKYKKCKKYFTHNNFIKNLSINKKLIPVYECPGCGTPFVIGVSHPVLIIPSRNMSQYNLDLIVEHELAHIKHHDNHFKILFTIVIIVHFYNPFVYVLFSLWNKYSEIYCDHTVIYNKKASDITNYAKLIIDLSTTAEPNRILWPLAGFSLTSYHIKGRINMIKKMPTPRPIIISILIIFTIFFASSFSVLAYTPKSVLYLDEISDTIWIDDSLTYLEPSDDYLHSIPDNLLLLEYSNGEKKYISDSELSIEPKAFCIHEYENCKLNSHSINSSGGCTITIYNAKICSKCSNTVIIDKYNQITNLKCTHNK